MKNTNKHYPDIVPVADIKQQSINDTFEFYKIVENENTDLDRYNKCLIMLLEEIDKYISAIFKRLSRLYWQKDYDTIKAEVKPLIDKFEVKRNELISKGMKPKYNAEDYCIYTYQFFLYNRILDLTLLEPRQNKVKTGQQRKPRKEFAEYIQHKKREQIANTIKTEFKSEKGKCIRFLIMALEENEPALISTANRQKKVIYEAMKKYINTDIGTYQSIFDFKFSNTLHGPDYEAVKQRVSKILKSLKINR